MFDGEFSLDPLPRAFCLNKGDLNVMMSDWIVGLVRPILR